MKSNDKSSKNNDNSSSRNSKSSKKPLEPIEFKAAGQRISLSKEQAIRKLKGTKPAVIQVHAVEIGGITYPVKQAFAVLTGLDPLDFSPNQARGVFRKLGFKLTRKT